MVLLSHRPPSTGVVHPTGNGSFTGSCPVWPTRDNPPANVWRVLPVNPHCSASGIYSTPINQHAHEAQEGEGTEKGEEGGEVGIHELSGKQRFLD